MVELALGQRDDNSRIYEPKIYGDEGLKQKAMLKISNTCFVSSKAAYRSYQWCDEWALVQLNLRFLRPSDGGAFETCGFDKSHPQSMLDAII
jgi:hypothetical protein